MENNEKNIPFPLISIIILNILGMCKIFSHNIKLSTIIIGNISNNTRKLVYGSSILGNILA